MHLRQSLLVFAAAAVLVAGASPVVRSATSPVQKIWTKDAPSFSVERYSDGRSMTLSDVRGKVALLYFFFPT